MEQMTELQTNWERILEYGMVFVFKSSLFKVPLRNRQSSLFKDYHTSYKTNAFGINITDISQNIKISGQSVVYKGEDISKCLRVLARLPI